MILHFKIVGNTLLTKLEIRDLIITGFSIILKKENIPTNKFYQWIFNDDNHDNKILVDQSLLILGYALNYYFEINLESNEKYLAPLEIIQNLKFENDNDRDKIIRDIAVSLIRYISKKSQEKEIATKINEIGANIIRQWEKNVPLWQALGSYLSKSLNENIYKNVCESIFLIRFFKNFFILKIGPLKDITFIKPIYLKLLNSLKMLKENCSSPTNLIEALNLTLEILKILKVKLIRK